MKRESGFVLAVTLWILAALAVLAAMVSVWALDGVRDATAVKESADDALEEYSTSQTVLYLLGTRDATRAGLPTVPIDRAEYSRRMLEELGALRRDTVGGELHMDGSVYRGVGETRVAIQDESGLLSIAWANEAGAQRLVDAVQGLPERPRLRDTLLDYVDEDQNQRPYGAEAPAYAAAALPAPADHRLASIQDLSSIIGWRDLTTAQLDEVRELSTPHYNGSVNLNSAPPAVLSVLIPGCPAACDSIVAQRRQEPFRNGLELQQRVAVQLDPQTMDGIRFMSSDVFRVTVWGRNGRGWRMHVQLTPMADKRAPWSILSVYPKRMPINDAQPTGSPLLAQAPARGR